jgi:hypothetical protein
MGFDALRRRTVQVSFEKERREKSQKRGGKRESDFSKSGNGGLGNSSVEFIRSLF